MAQNNAGDKQEQAGGGRGRESSGRIRGDNIRCGFLGDGVCIAVTGIRKADMS